MAQRAERLIHREEKINLTSFRKESATKCCFLTSIGTVLSILLQADTHTHTKKEKGIHTCTHRQTQIILVFMIDLLQFLTYSKVLEQAIFQLKTIPNSYSYTPKFRNI